ncbi:MAG: cohesin domain-containing protein [Oscillospiraceae bacterium]|nr:cohesin domain-containing protein [Oscillospiraceae bacterium]
MQKRVVMITILSLIMIFSLIVPIFAALPTYTVAVTVDKTMGVGQEKEVTFIFNISNFTGFPSTNSNNGGSAQNGVNSFKATLNYDDNVFYPIDIDANGTVTTVTSTGDLSLKPLNGWTDIKYNPNNNGSKTLAMVASSFINTTQDFLQVTLKVKAGATVGNTTVSLTNMTASDQVNDLVPTNATVSQVVTIVGSASDAIGGYIRIAPNTTVADFKKFNGKASYASFKTEQGKALADTDVIPTGATASDGQYSYTLIAVGDINSDGQLTVTDLSQIKGFEVGLITTLTDNQKRACDIKWDGKYTVLDRSQMRLMLVNLGDPPITVWSGTGTATCIPVTAP